MAWAFLLVSTTVNVPSAEVNDHIYCNAAGMRKLCAFFSGKATVHTAAGGIHPRYTLPITIDVVCNRRSIREDPFYVGLRQVHSCKPKVHYLRGPWNQQRGHLGQAEFLFHGEQERVRGDKYDELVDEIVDCLRQRYGPSLVIHWEDFAASNAFRLLAKYRERVRPISYPQLRILSNHISYVHIARIGLILTS